MEISDILTREITNNREVEIVVNPLSSRIDQILLNNECTLGRSKEELFAERVDEIIRNNKNVLICHQCPEGQCQCQTELKTLREERKNLLLERDRMAKETKKLKAEYSQVVADLEKAKKKRDREKQLEKLVKQLKEKKNELDRQNKRLRSEIKNVKKINEKYEKILNEYFTPGQLRRLMMDSTNSRLHWSPEDIACAISLRCASIKGYRYLKYKRNYPLPHVRTLRRWAQKVPIQEGVMDTVFELMSHKGKSLNEQERLTVLSFDEMSVNPHYCYDKNMDKIYGDVEKVQVLMARGLTKNWKQPIAYFFDTDMTKELLFSILEKLYDINFHVVGIVSDLGGQNRSFLTQLQITNEYVWFAHHSNAEMKVFVYADAPHLLKLIRNHFLDEGFVYKDTEIRRDIIEKVLSVSKSEITITPRLTHAKHLDVSGRRRMRVKPAVQLMSHHTANLIQHCCDTNKIEVRNHTVVVEVFRAIANWYSLFDNLDKADSLNEKYAYGLDIEKQNAHLQQIVQVIGKMRQIKILKSGQNTNALLPCQKGILMNIKSLKEMFLYVKERYKVEYILTRRLNQDPLENFFGIIRGMGAQNDSPVPTDFKYRMKLYILGRYHSAVFTMNRNTEEIVDEETLTTPRRTFNLGASKSRDSTASRTSNVGANTKNNSTARRSLNLGASKSDDSTVRKSLNVGASKSNDYTAKKIFHSSANIGENAEDEEFLSLADEFAQKEIEERYDDSSDEDEDEDDDDVRKQEFVPCSADMLVTNIKKIVEEKPDSIEDQDEKEDQTAEENDTESQDLISQEESDNADNQRDKDGVDEIWSTLKKDAGIAEKEVEKEGFEYLAGYVAHCYRGKYSHLGRKTSEDKVDDKSWLALVSKGSLICPAPEFVDLLKIVEATFLSYHGFDKGRMTTGEKSIATILEQSNKKLEMKFSKQKLKLYPDEVIRCFIRVRTYIRIRGCNDRIDGDNLVKKNGKKLNNKNNKLGFKLPKKSTTKNTERVNAKKH